MINVQDHSSPPGSSLIRSTGPTGLCTLSVSFRCIVTILHNQILGTVIMLSAQVALQNRLGAISVSLLRIEGSTRHVGNHGVSAVEGVLGVAERVVLGSGLWEPNVTAITAEVAGLKGFSDIFLDNDGATGSVDEPRACKRKKSLVHERRETRKW